MAPKKPLKVTSSSTRAARVKGGSNPVVTQGAARNRAARTTLGPAPKQRPLATGGTKGPLQGGTRTANMVKPSGMAMSGDRTAAVKGAGNPAGPRAPKPAFGPVPNVKQTTLAQQRGQAAVQAAQAKRGAKAASQRMGAIVKGAQAARNVAGVLKTGIRGGAFAAGIQAYNTGAGTLDKMAPQVAKQIAAMKNKVGPKIVGPKKVGPGKVGTIAQSFDKSFTAARKAGKTGFTFKGKKYTTKMK